MVLGFFMEVEGLSGSSKEEEGDLLLLFVMLRFSRSRRVIFLVFLGLWGLLGFLGCGLDYRVCLLRVALLLPFGLRLERGLECSRLLFFLLVVTLRLLFFCYPEFAVLELAVCALLRLDCCLALRILFAGGCSCLKEVLSLEISSFSRRRCSSLMNERIQNRFFLLLLFRYGILRNSTFFGLALVEFFLIQLCNFLLLRSSNIC